MTDLPALSYLHPNHPLLREIQERDFEIARLHRVIAASDAKITTLQAGKRRIAAAVAAARRRQEAAQEPAYRSQ